MLVVVFKSSTRLHSGFPCNFGPETDDKEARGGENTFKNLSYSCPTFSKNVYGMKRTKLAEKLKLTFLS